MRPDCRLSPTGQLTQSPGHERTHSQAAVPIGKIVPNPNQPRKHLSKGKLDELVLSIRKRGVLTPVRVRELRSNEGYELIAGERRWRAAMEAGLEEVPATIVHGQAPEKAQVDAYLRGGTTRVTFPLNQYTDQVLSS